MARPLRIEYPGAWFHVMNRGLARRRIFRNDLDRRFFLSFLGETSDIYKIEVHAYSLMDNHYHLLIRLPNIGLSRAMRHLNGVYTQKANKMWGSDGPIFRGRYKACLVNSEEYLLELVRYIHLNPVKAGICKSASQHPWTSHLAYIDRKKRPRWLITSEVIRRFGKHEKQAMHKLSRYVSEGVPANFRRELEKNGKILGSIGFCEWVYRNFVEPHRKGIPLKERKPKPKIPLGLILSQVAHGYNVPTSHLRNGRSGVRNEARSLAVFLARTLSGTPHSQVAQWFQAADGNTIAQIQHRFKKRLEKNWKLRKLTNQLSHSILNNVRP